MDYYKLTNSQWAGPNLKKWRPWVPARAKLTIGWLSTVYKNVVRNGCGKSYQLAALLINIFLGRGTLIEDSASAHSVKNKNNIFFSRKVQICTCRRRTTMAFLF
jgi:hypothetical protein